MVSASSSQNNNYENEVNAPINPHPTDIIIDRIDASDDGGIVEDSSCPLGSSSKLTDHFLAKDKSKMSIVTPKWYFDSLFACILHMS